MSGDESMTYEAGELLLLEAGEYSDRYNIGLFRVTKGFDLRDLPSRELPQHMIGRGKDWKCLSDEFRDKHLEELDFDELNIDFITVRAEEGHPGYKPPPTEDEKAQQERREFKLSRAGL